MNKQKGLAPILIVLLIALAVGGYLVYQKQNKPVVLQPVTQSSVNPTTSPAASDAAETTNPDSIGSDWKTYTNNKLGYSFKYPSNGNIQNAVDKTDVIYLNNDSNKPYYLLSLEVKNNQNNLTARQVLENEVQALRNNNNIPGDGAKLLADYRQSTIKDYQSGLINGFSIRWGRDGDSTSDAIEVVSINSNKVYTFLIHDGNGSVSEYQKKLIDQILSTFKFTQ